MNSIFLKATIFDYLVVAGLGCLSVHKIVREQSEYLRKTEIYIEVVMERSAFSEESKTQI
jgi:hypothetical protein